MSAPYNSRAWTSQGFEVLDSDGKVTDGVCRILFRGFMISLSSWNYSLSNSLNAIFIYKSVKGEQWPYSQCLANVYGDRLSFRTAQAAINYILENNLDAED